MCLLVKVQCMPCRCMFCYATQRFLVMRLFICLCHRNLWLFFNNMSFNTHTCELFMMSRASFASYYITTPNHGKVIPLGTDESEMKIFMSISFTLGISPTRSQHGSVLRDQLVHLTYSKFEHAAEATRTHMCIMIARNDITPIILDLANLYFHAHLQTIPLSTSSHLHVTTLYHV